MKKDIISRLKRETNSVPNVLEKIKKHPDFFVPEPRREFKYRPRLKYAFLSVIMILLFIVTEPLKAEAVITMDINPSIQFEVNKNERVISIKGINDDGKELIKDVKYRGSHIEKVLDRLIEAAIEKKYITEDDYILIGIKSENEDFSEKVSKKMNEKIEDKLKEKNKNSEVIIEKIKNAKDSIVAGNSQVEMSNTKTNLVNEVISLTDYTNEDFEELAAFKVKDLYSLIKEEYIRRIIESTDYLESDHKKLSRMNIKKLKEILDGNQ